MIDIWLHHNNLAQVVQYSCNGLNSIENAYIDLWPKVDDQIRGYYKYNHQSNNWKSVPMSYTNNDVTRVALIVESPHKDEFDDIFNPLCPLNGVSGKKFSRKILSNLSIWFHNVSISSVVEIYIMNPIQYQASLYHFLNDKINYNRLINNKISLPGINAKLRNEVWKILFNDPLLKGDFVDRITKYNPHYIVNCCTGKKVYGIFCNPRKPRNNSTQLNSFVRRVLLAKNLIHGNYLEFKHPCVW